MANDFKFGNKAIQDLYFGNKAVLQVYFGDKLIWQKLQKILLTQNDNVVIEYEPSANEEIEHISCFFNPTDDNSTQIFFKIFHESGLVVAQVGSDSIDSQVTELYELQGQKRIVTLNPKLTLRAGEKYYFQYTYNNGVQIKPTYFQGMTGNYKVFRNNENKNVANISSLGDYLGYVDDLGDFMEASNNDFMVWDVNGENLTQGNVYVRGSQTCTKYYGNLGSGSYGGAEAQQIYFMQVGEIFKWTGYNGAGDDRLHSNYFYRRLDYPMKLYTTEVNLNNYSNNMQKITAVILGASKKNDDENTAGAKFTGNIWGYAPYFDNIIYTLNDGYTVDFDWADADAKTLVLENDPGTYVEKRFYYMNHNNTAGLYLYLNGNLILMNEYNGAHQEGQYDRIIDYITEVDALNAVTEVGTITSFISNTFDGNYYSNNFRQASLETTKKFYLQIDGREV
jgi:hypothetical protein